MRSSVIAGLAIALLGTASARAHVVLSPAQAPAGSYYAGTFRVSHGCAGSPTVGLTVTIPAGVVVAKPQPKPGWALAIVRQPLATPVPGEGGRKIDERVASITWRGWLPDDQFDEFRLFAKLPDVAGPLYFRTVQTCENGETRWVETPGVAGGKPAHPAPVVELSAAAPSPGDMPGMDMRGH
jgi:uncharacterized protein YcnI